MICEKCGNEMPDNVKFCGICGTPGPLPQSEDEPVREQRAYDQRPDEPDREYRPYKQPEDGHEYRPCKQPENEPVRSYRAYEQETAPNETERAAEKVKVKRTCSLSAVVFCGVVIFMLSVVCGVFAGLYFNARMTAAAVAPCSLVQYETGGES